MSKRPYLVEITYMLPVFKHVMVEASTAARACEFALADQDWEGAEKAYDESKNPFVSGLWAGSLPYQGRIFVVPLRFRSKEELAMDIVRGLSASSTITDDFVERCALVARQIVK